MCVWIPALAFVVELEVNVNGLHMYLFLKPKETLHFELPNISLLFLSIAKLNIAMSCWYPP